jgi:hypothetical protein
MNKLTKKILIWTISIIGIGILGYLSFVGFVLYTFMSGCGMDDGPFNAVLTNQNKLSENSITFDLKNNGILILDNRTDSLPPTLTLKENGIIKWTLDTNTSNTKGYESTRIWKISNVTITNNTDHIKLNFTGHWTYGAEAGSMKIDRKDGENSFCLSW